MGDAFTCLALLAALLSGAFFRPFSSSQSVQPLSVSLRSLIFPRLQCSPPYIFCPSLGETDYPRPLSFRSPSLLSIFALSYFRSFQPSLRLSTSPPSPPPPPQAPTATAATPDRTSPSSSAGGSRRRPRFRDGRSRHRRRYRRVHSAASGAGSPVCLPAGPLVTAGGGDYYGRWDEVEILVFEKWPNIAVVSVVVDAHPDDDDGGGGTAAFLPPEERKPKQPRVELRRRRIDRGSLVRLPKPRRRRRRPLRRRWRQQRRVLIPSFLPSERGLKPQKRATSAV